MAHRFRLEAGDAVIMDNHRILHGRAPIVSAGSRFLQGLLLRARRPDEHAAHASGGSGAVMTAVIVDSIFETFRRSGDDVYLGEDVSLTEHMLQTALAAEQDEAPAELVAAAVLHDFGHMVHELDEDCAAEGIDSQHEEVGAGFLERHFPPAVTEPIRLHVASKRYLCAVDPAYLAQLSPASRQSLDLQGGPFSSAAGDRVRGRPLTGEAAVRLRRYDDYAKIPGLPTPDLEHYRPALEAVMRG